MIILGKKVVGRKETLEYASKKFKWSNKYVIGISSYYAFWAWILARLTGKKCIYYCIDYYTYRVKKDFIDGITIWLAIKLDKFLCNHVDNIWDISHRIDEGRWEMDKYFAPSTLVPLSYPPDYFRFKRNFDKRKIVFVGLDPYGLELIKNYPKFEWLGKGKMPIDELLDKLSYCGIGLSLWKKNGNNYYGDPGKTKLYSACGLPVIMTNNTPYSEIIQQTRAGIVIMRYSRRDLERAIRRILNNYDFYKNNVKKTWKYINADKIFRNIRLLE